jgi:hypothetical protein
MLAHIYAPLGNHIILVFDSHSISCYSCGSHSLPRLQTHRCADRSVHTEFYSKHYTETRVPVARTSARGLEEAAELAALDGVFKAMANLTADDNQRRNGTNALLSSAHAYIEEDEDEDYEL